MDDLSLAILDAWALHGPRIMSDPLEIQKRLARRRMKTFRKPLRAWCLAVRANDTRINAETERITPYCAADVHHPENFAKHEVTISGKTLKRLCKPVHIEACGRTIFQVAEMLGVTTHALDYPIKKKAFKVEMKCWGKTEKEVRVLKCDHPLDPSASNLKSGSDPLLLDTWATLSMVVPDEMEQKLQRVPWAHSAYGTFYGWRWVCPACGKLVKTIFYPVPAMSFAKFYGIDPARSEIDQVQDAPSTFACVRCHGVRYFNRIGPNMWNELIFHMSGGLLYGYEVKRPTYVYHTRKKPFRPRLNQAPSKRREEVLQGLLKRMMYKDIANDLGIRIGTVRMHVDRIYKQHRVHGREELIRQLNPELACGAR